MRRHPRVLASVDLWRATGISVMRMRRWSWPASFWIPRNGNGRTGRFHCRAFFTPVPRETASCTTATAAASKAHCGPDGLCEALPNHPDWMKWYSAVVLHAEYLKAMAKYTEPYSVMPASIYRDDEYLGVPESRRESFRKQVLNGMPLGAGHYLRLFPVWMDYRGHFGTILPQAQALANAAHLRGDLEAAQSRSNNWSG